MRKFLSRALRMIGKLDADQIRALVDELANENEILESSMHSMTAGVVVIDRNGVVSFANKAVKRIIPIAKSDPTDMHYTEAVLEEEIVKLIKISEENEETIHDREIAMDAPGGARIITCSILPLLIHEEISGSLLYIRDVTERKHSEARLRRAESLASLTTMTAGMAHEIKNPLGSIGIHIQLMQKALKREEGCAQEFIEKNLGIISEEVERLNSIVVDFLFAVRPMDVNMRDTCLSGLINESLELVKPELDEEGIELEISIDENIPMLQLDEKLIKQAVLNIIKNAMNAMPDGGHLSLSITREGDSAVLVIKDDGEGIEKENLDKIFEPYFTTKDFGSGLGLTLVYKIIKEHDGEIQLKSKVGVGTSFIIRLPVPQKEKHLISYNGENDEV
ncbi:MAG: ATP-binding protein [Spirochaetales bacterium]|uniref:histidine kinase n=1 Tax=Candidatus Thalassospirochaeta sargassi TaxID=3119039 RepID=A0AAJ1MPU2_9SPIO|nr:ATP-binding protein [Spirochaetales bacterium]